MKKKKHQRKIKYIQALLFLLIAMLLSSCAPKKSNSIPKDTEKLGYHYLIISIDALHPNAIGANTSPFIYSLMKKGYGFMGGQSIEPLMTLFNHTAMFTGLTPEQSGQVSNGWEPGQLQNQHPTFFETAAAKGYLTGYYYSKGNLGYLVNDSIKFHKLAGMQTIHEADKFIPAHSRTFTFLHTSGLDFTGKQYGWLSPRYMEMLRQIDQRLKPLIEKIMAQKNFVILITSDHAGHDRQHGTNHPEDYKVPFIFYSDYKQIQPLTKYRTTDLKGIIEKLLI